MRSDEYAPIGLNDGLSTPAGATPWRRSLRRLLVAILGLIALTAFSFFPSGDGDGMNLETGSNVESTTASAASDSADDLVVRGTLVVDATDGSGAELLTLDEDTVIDGVDATATSTETETSLGSAESTESAADDPGEPDTDSPAATASSDSNGDTDVTTTTTRRTTTTQRTATAEQPATTQRTPTAEQPATTQRTPTTQRITTTTAPVTVNGDIVWVDSRAGGGGDGSQARPFRTINDGILAVRAGETLMVKGGEYREHVNPGYRMPRGTSSSRITMTNAPGERVVIKGRVILTDLDYWTIKGINVTWDSDRNGRSVEHLIILNGGVNWEWRDSEIWGAKAYSAMLITKNPRNFAVRHNHIHDTYRTNDTNQDHLIYCACGTGGGTIERNLLVGSSNGRAVKLGGSNSSGAAVGNVTIRYNTMVDNYGPSNIQLSFNTSNITMERNLMVGSRDYAENISTYKLTGSGSRASNNLGFKSPGVLENHGGIGDGGGNIHRDPRLDSNYIPQDATAKAYGHRAP